MTVYTRRAIFLKWDEGGSHFAFKVQQLGFSSQKQIPESEGRGLYDSRLLAINSTNTPRSVTLPVVARSTVSGTANDGVEDVDYGDYDDLLSAWGYRVLEVKLFGDSAYWEARWSGNFAEQLGFDPVHNVLILTMPLLETLSS